MTAERRVVSEVEVEVEIGWSPRSTSHVIVGHDPRPRTACGKTLTGLADNRWGSASTAACGTCRRRTASARGSS